MSRLGLGLASVGGLFSAVPEEQAIATVDRGWQLGVRLFDTAPVYGYGLSERRAGLALRGRPRDEYVLCTKVGRLLEPGGPELQPIWADPPPGIGARLDYSYRAVIRSFEESLQRMGIDRIDILHIHDPEQDYPLASTEALRALIELRDRGTIRAISLGVNHADVAERFLRETGPAGPDCILLAGRYSVLDRTGAVLLDLCHQLGVAVIAAGVFQGGLLTDALEARNRSRGTASVQAAGTPQRTGQRGTDQRISTKVARRADALAELCARYSVEPLAAAVQFPLQHPAVPTILVGARTPTELTDAAGYLAEPVPGPFWRELVALLD